MRLSPSRWAELVAAHRTSGLSLEQFAKRNQVNPKSLGWWRARLRRDTPAPAFVEVQVEPLLAEPPMPAPMLRLELATGRVRVDVPVGLDLVWLRQVVQALS